MNEGQIGQYQILSIILMGLGILFILGAILFFLRAAGGPSGIVKKIQRVRGKRPAVVTDPEADQFKAFAEIVKGEEENETSDLTERLGAPPQDMFRIRKKIIITHDKS